jgi:hypothetical protein
MKIKEQREQLEKLINIASSSIDQNVPKQDEMPPELQAEPTMDVDFTELRFQCDDEAMNLLKKSIAFIIPAEMLENNQYIVEKLKNDSFALSGILYQLRSCEAVQKSLMEQIKSGMTHPRMYEVFGGLVKNIGEINKQMIQTVEALSQTYKTMKDDIKQNSMEALGSGQQNNMGMLTTGDGGVVSMGTKDLIKTLYTGKNSQSVVKIEDVKEIKD